MKTALLFTIFFISVNIFAQSTPEEYWINKPGIPSDACILKDADKDNYLEQVFAYSKKLGSEVGQLRREARENARKKEGEMKAGALRNAGFSEADASKMKNKKELSNAEGMEMASRMMQQRAGISMEDAKKLQKMTKAEKDAWTAQYASNQMTNAQDNPNRNNMQADQQRSKGMYELASEQKMLTEKLTSGEAAHLKQIEKLDADAAQGKKDVEIQLKPLKDELAKIPDEGATKAQGERAIQINKQILEYWKKYCAKYTPRYLEMLAEYRSYVESILPDIKRQEEIANQLMMIQTGMTEPLSRPGELRLSEIKEYVDLLKEIFKYRFY